MPIELDGKKVYRIGEALETAGLSRSTYFRWVRESRVHDTKYRDRTGRRVFTPEELDALRAEARQLVPASPQLSLLEP